MNKTTQDRRSGIGFGFEEFDRNDNNNGNAVDMAAVMASLDAAPKQLRPGLVTKGTYLGNGFVAIAGAKFDALLHPLDRNAEPERGFEGTIVIVSNREENAKAHSDEGGTMFASFLVAKDWQALQEAKESNTPVRGKVVYKLNRRGGGFNGYKVRVGSVVGFLPASALRGVQNSQGLLNEEIDVDVVTAEPESNNLKFNLQSRANARIERYAALQVDDLVKGRVHKVLEFGVLVDIGDGCTGLLHRSEMNAGASRRTRPSTWS
jgi:small subunit ribosomal protein S1